MKCTICGLVLVLAIGVLVPVAYADMLSPLKQLESGIPLYQIRCNAENTTLLQSPSGRPACVTMDTSDKLLDRGFTLVKSVPQNTSTESLDSLEPEKLYDMDVYHSSTHFNIHDYTYEFRGFPVVGETGELILTMTHKILADDAIKILGYDEDGNPIEVPAVYGVNAHLYPVKLDIAFLPPSTIRVYDIVSNINSDDPFVFLPYDHTTETTIAEPGKTYTVKAKVDVLEEGFVFFYAKGLEGDYVQTSYAIGKDETLEFWEYEKYDETYLDHTLRKRPVTGDSQSQLPVDQLVPPEPKIAPEPTTPRNHEEEYEEWKNYIASYHLEEESPYEDVLEELVQYEFTIQNMREFFANRMNYTNAVIDELISSLPDDYGAGSR